MRIRKSTPAKSELDLPTELYIANWMTHLSLNTILCLKIFCFPRGVKLMNHKKKSMTLPPANKHIFITKICYLPEISRRQPLWFFLYHFGPRRGWQAESIKIIISSKIFEISIKFFFILHSNHKEKVN